MYTLVCLLYFSDDHHTEPAKKGGCYKLSGLVSKLRGGDLDDDGKHDRLKTPGKFAQLVAKSRELDL